MKLSQLQIPNSMAEIPSVALFSYLLREFQEMLNCLLENSSRESSCRFIVPARQCHVRNCGAVALQVGQPPIQWTPAAD